MPRPRDYAEADRDTNRLREAAVGYLDRGNESDSNTAFSIAASLIRIGDLLWQHNQDYRVVQGGVREEENEAS